MTTDPNQISQEAWDANAEHWDAAWATMAMISSTYSMFPLELDCFYVYNNSSSKIYTERFII